MRKLLSDYFFLRCIFVKKYKVLKKLFVLTVLFVALFPQFVKAQNAFDNRSRAVFIFDIVKYVKWHSEDSIKVFKIAVLDKNDELLTELKKMAAERGNVHGKTISVSRYSDVENVPHSQVIFSNKDNGFSIYKLQERVKGKNILLITENYEFHKSMINFIVINNEKRFELNEDKIKEEGFTVTPLFVALAVKSKADWEKLYEQTDIELQKEKETVAQQKKIIDDQKKEIEKQEKRLAEQRKEIDEQQKRIDQQKNELLALMGQVKVNQAILKQKLDELAIKQKELDAQKAQMVKQHQILEGQKEEITEQESKIAEQKKVLNEQLEKIHLQQFILYMFFALALVLAGLGFFIYRAYKIKKQSNKLLREKNHEILQQNEEIRQQKEEIEAQRDEIERARDEAESQRNIAIAQRDEITHQKKEITDSIHYARRIQQAVLPPPRFLNELMKDNYFILNKPRDIVSGDYYWMAEFKDQIIIAAADCTGHGVPGAFMSLLGVAFLKEILGKTTEFKANVILDELRKYVINALHQPGVESQTRDGMDMAMCVLDFDHLELQFAGANNPLYLIRDGALLEFKADKQPIGLYEENKPFNNNVIPLKKGDSFYIFSDGYADQFGGPKFNEGGKKFKYSRFKELLINIQNEKMNNQSEILNKTIEEWRGPLYQVDDILVIGVRI
jgi:serine phosphatase RsbU (regulator of sigma subunit)